MTGPLVGPALGERAPSFSARNHHAETVELTGPAVVMFYPFAFSRVCGSELAQLHRRWPEVEAAGARVFAVSCDAVHTLRAYAEALVAEGADRDLPPEALGFDLVSDFWPHGEIAQSYGVFDAGRGAARRSSFILDSAGFLQHIQSVPLGEARDFDETLSVLRGLAGGRLPGGGSSDD